MVLPEHMIRKGFLFWKRLHPVPASEKLFDESLEEALHRLDSEKRTYFIVGLKRDKLDEPWHLYISCPEHPHKSVQEAFEEIIYKAKLRMADKLNVKL